MIDIAEIVELREGKRIIGTVIHVSHDVAIQIIASLSSQIINNCPNSGRAEMTSNQGYFSISVEPQEKLLTEKQWEREKMIKNSVLATRHGDVINCITDGQEEQRLVNGD